MFIVALIATTGAWADELTVFDGDDVSNNVPVYGYYADNYLKCEVVMPADELTAMAGGTISAMKFHTYAPASAQWGAANFVVFLKEISGTILNAYKGSDNATIVYEGGLDGTGETMNVEFTNPYVYQGGNLLIGVYCTATGSYKSISFKGTTVDGASVQGYSESSLDAVTCNQRNFIPKTTFTYTPGEIDTSLALSVIETEHGAIELTVGGVVATKAEAGDEVLITATPENDDWAVKEIVAIPYIGWGGAQAPRRTPEILKIELTPVEGSNNQWTFEMPAYPVKVKATFYYARFNIVFKTTGEYTIQDGYATVAVDGDDVTEDIDQTGMLPDVAEGATITITAEPGFKVANVTALYKEQSATGASGELTVHDGSVTSSYVPVYGLWADDYLKHEIVMPAADLADMAGSNINSMKFYLSQSAEQAWTSTFQVFLKEVAETEISEYYGTAGATVVYEGTLDATGSEMEITFTTPYQYNGGNLLIGIYGITKGIYSSAYFIGETATGASISGYSSVSLDAATVNQRNFLPKTTFTYSGGAGGEEEIQVGDGDKTDNYLPTYNLYNYSLTQQIYTASEIGTSGAINSIAYYCTSNATPRNLDIYLVHTSKDAFDSTTDWIPVSKRNKVFSGTVDFVQDEWTTITFDTPFIYNGTDNLCVVVDDNTGTWHSSMHFKTYDAANQSIVVYHDDINYEISSTSSYTGYFKAWKNQMILDISPVTTLDVDLAADGTSASFTVPEGVVTVNYELERLGTPVEVAAGKYITYYTDKDVVIFDEDFELLTVTAVDATTVIATPIEVAAAETPLLVYNSSDKDKKVWIVPTEETPDNLTPDVIDVAPEFKGTLEEKTFTAAEMSAAKHFVCNGETFMLVRREGTIGANKCWLELSNNAPQNARTIVIGTAEATGIADMNRETITNNRYYDLQGRRVMQPAKGLYINNGKKVMVK